MLFVEQFTELIQSMSIEIDSQNYTYSLQNNVFNSINSLIHQN